MEVDPLYYVSQVVLFVSSSVLVGFFVYQLQVEIATTGWIVTPRSVWFSCLVSSSLLFAVYQMDPLGALGLYQFQWAIYLGWLALVLLLDSVACTSYMYVIVLYKQHLQDVPQTLTRVWLSTNLFFSLLILVGALIGSLSNNIFWYGVVVIVIILQEVSLIVVINISLHKITQVLSKLAISTGDSFHTTVRKMWVFRLVSFFIALFAIVNQLVGSEDAISSLGRYGEPIVPYPLDEYNILYVVPDILVVLGHLLLLYSLRCPEAKENKISRMQNSVTKSTSARSNPSG